jgi:hypothetical protein
MILDGERRLVTYRKVRAAYEEGQSLRQVAARYGLAIEGVRYRLKKMGVPLRPPHVTRRPRP